MNDLTPPSGSLTLGSPTYFVHFPPDVEAPISHLPARGGRSHCSSPPPHTPRFPGPPSPSRMSSGWTGPIPRHLLFHGKEMLSGMPLLKARVWNLSDTHCHKEGCLNHGWSAQKMHKSSKPGAKDPAGSWLASSPSLHTPGPGHRRPGENGPSDACQEWEC